MKARREAMASKWAVLVVHGVGETGPGATVDAFVPSLAAARPEAVDPDGDVEILWLRPDAIPRPPNAPPPPPPFPPQETPPEPNPVFPVHVRRARLAGGDGGPDQAIFAEVY
jgi:hypothetical protein